MKQLFGYVRVSTLKQGDGVSLDAQREAIEEYAAINDIKITRWFEEKETAAKKGRPVFNGMIRDIKSGQSEGLVIHKIDRSARNFADWNKIHELADAGYHIEFATESLDFKSRGGRLTADIQAVIAADYIRNLREECKKGIHGRLKQGLYPFKAPCGYFDNGGGKAKTIDPIKGPLVKKMFDLYASGNYSFWSLPAEMERRGLTNDRGAPYSKTSIEKILKNPFYTGVIKIRTTGQIYSGIHDPLISVDLFEAVQDVRAGRDNKKSTKHRHPYRGMFRCGNCEGAMIGELQRGHIYYRCHQKTCATKTVREELLEAAIYPILMRCNLTEEAITNMRQMFQEWIEEREGDSIKDKAPLELAKLSNRLSKLTDKLIDEVIDNDTFLAKKQEIILAQAKWQQFQTQTSTLTLRLQKLDKFLEHVKSLYSTYQVATSDRKREILNFLTSNRWVTGKNIEIEPRKWLFTLENMLSVRGGAPPNPTSRTAEPNLDMTGMLDELGDMIEESASGGDL